MLMTKKMFCKSIISEFKHDRNLQFSNMTDEQLIPYIFESTRLGIALVELGILTKEKYPAEYDYISQRGGIIFTHYSHEDKDTYFITVRDILAMLPDEIKKEN